MIKEITSYALLASALVSTSAYAMQEGEEMRFEKITKITMKVDEGDIKIFPHNEPFVKVSSKMRGNGKDTKNVAGQTLIIENNKKRGGDYCDYTISVPRTVGFEANVGAGILTVDDIEAPINIDLGAGKITFNNVIGDIKAKNGAGDILFTTQKLPQSVKKLEFSTGWGRIHTKFPKDTTISYKKMPSCFMGVVEVQIPTSLNPHYYIDFKSGGGGVFVNRLQSNY